jgi:hypothetical protein
MHLYGARLDNNFKKVDCSKFDVIFGHQIKCDSNMKLNFSVVYKLITLHCLDSLFNKTIRKLIH